MKAEDLVKPGAVVLAVMGGTALGFVAGYLVGRDPQLLRKLMRSGASGFERLAGAVAETREELADLWAASREDAREAIEDGDLAAVAASATIAAASSAARKAPPAMAAAVPAKAVRKTTPKARSPRRSRAGRKTGPSARPAQ